MNNGSHAFLVAKGKSIDRLSADMFGDDDIWCLNQSADVVASLGLRNRIVVCQNDEWTGYTPPEGLEWHCGPAVKTDGRENAFRYFPEMLTGHWASPTCVCAMQLMIDEGYDHITMVGFDSYFDGSRDYAVGTGAKSDGIAPFHFYNTMMRRLAFANHIRLTWLDTGLQPHDDGFGFSKCLVAVALGERYERQTDRMVESFLRHNPDWSVERWYGDRLLNALPSQCRSWSPFNKVELGRWIAMKKCLEDYEVVLYADGDIRWYGDYAIGGYGLYHDMFLFPHYVTQLSRQNAKHLLHKDGIANIGLIQISRCIDHDRLFDFVINEVLHNPPAFMHGQQLWLQNLVSSIPDCGFDAVYDMDPGQDCASWNLRKGDREIYEQDGRYMVRTCNGLVAKLVSFHFSSKSLGSLVNYGDAVKKLLEDYLNEQ